MTSTDRSLTRQRRIGILSVVVLGVWLCFLLDPAMRPLLLFLAGTLLGGGAIVGLGMVLGAFGFSLLRQFSRPVGSGSTSWPEFNADVPRAKPSGPPHWMRLAVPGLCLFLITVFALAAARDPWGLQRWIFVGLLVAFGLFVVGVVLGGLTLGLARLVRRLMGGSSGSHDAMTRWGD